MILTPLQAAGALHAAGMPVNRLTEWVAIGMGESDLDTEAVSSAGALGWLQIMPFNFAPNGVDIASWRDPILNAAVAVKMSGHGTNCAAWDSSYANIRHSGRYTFLGWPEPGSADYDNLPVAAAHLGTHMSGGMFPPAIPSVSSGAIAAMARIDRQAQWISTVISRELLWQRMRINSMFKPAG